MKKELCLVAIVLIELLCQQSGFCASDRVALVIGNKDYKDNQLINPVNDANAIHSFLSRVGFDVIKRTDITHEEMSKALREFGGKIKPGGVALFYFSGHGMQTSGKNYLLPIGSDIVTEDEAPFKSIDADQVLAKMEYAKSAVNIMILDACRNNPFKGVRSSSQGLASMFSSEGSFIAYATAPGKTASDNGRERNSIYTKNLLAELEKPNVPIEQAFRNIRTKVRAESGGKQIPWDSSSLLGDSFYFIPPNNTPPPHNPSPQGGRTIGQYIDHGNGTITDTKTSLMWKRCSEGLSGVNCEEGKAEEYKYDDAVQRFKNVKYAGYSDWRLPTIKELKTLVYCSNGVQNKYNGLCNDGSEKPTINQQVFPNTTMLYWSGSPYAGYSDSARLVDFGSGFSYLNFRSAAYAVRLVRGGQ